MLKLEKHSPHALAWKKILQATLRETAYRSQESLGPFRGTAWRFASFLLAPVTWFKQRGKGFPVGIRKLNERVDRKNRAPKARASEGKALKRNFEGQLGNPKKNKHVCIYNKYIRHTYTHVYMYIIVLLPFCRTTSRDPIPNPSGSCSPPLLTAA